MQLSLTNIEKVQVPEMKSSRVIYTNLTDMRVDSLDSGYEEMIPS